MRDIFIQGCLILMGIISSIGRAITEHLPQLGFYEYFTLPKVGLVQLDWDLSLHLYEFNTRGFQQKDWAIVPFTRHQLIALIPLQPLVLAGFESMFLLQELFVNTVLSKECQAGKSADLLKSSISSCPLLVINKLIMIIIQYQIMDSQKTETDIVFRNILNKDSDKATCNIIKVGDISMMFDCGCDEQISKANLELVLHHAKLVDFIFLSHASFMHVGALPYLAANNCLDQMKIMSTSPSAKMGALTMYELYIQRKEIDNFDLFKLQDVEAAFEKVELVSFKENRRIKVRDTELMLSALPSGNSIGGTAWKIEYNKQVIIYAVELNDKPLQITHPMKFDDFKNANLLITNAYITPTVTTASGSQKSTKIFQYVSQEKLRLKMEKVLVDNGGQIMIPCTTKNRILQLLITLENMFHTNSKLQAGFKGQSRVPIVYLEHMSTDTLGVGRSHLGWMYFQDNKVFQDLDENPFNFQFIKPIHSVQEYMEYADGPRILITSLSSFEQGFSRKLVRDFAAKPKNEIVFIQKLYMPSDSVGLRLLKGEKLFQMVEYDIIGNLDGDADMNETEAVTAPTPKDTGDPFNRKPFIIRDQKNPPNIGESSINYEPDTTSLSRQTSQPFFADHENGQMTLAQNQFIYSREAYMNKLYERKHKKLFSSGPYPNFSLEPVDQITKLSFYGEDLKEEKEDVEVNEERVEMEQAVANVMNEETQIQSYNRFKDLQKQYARQFLYHSQEVEVEVRCSISYVPFADRIDKVSFELMIRKAMPKDIIVINTSQKKVDKIKEFCEQNEISSNVYQAAERDKTISFQTNAAMKQVFVDENLYKRLPLQKVQKKYEIARVKAAIEPSPEGVLSFDLLYEIPSSSDYEQSKDQFDRKSLFFRGQDYKLADLQQYLAQQNIPTLLVDKCLNFDDKIYIYFDKANQIRLEGFISKEYFAIRALLYAHFGRI